MIFTAVVQFILSFIISTASTVHILSHSRNKYGETLFLTLRKCERLTKRLQKAKCDTEFIRTCLIYNLVPSFVRFHCLKQSFVSDEQALLFKRQCLQHEFQSHHKTVVRLNRELKSLLDSVEKIVSMPDFYSITLFLHQLATRERNYFSSAHLEKLERLNHGPVGQNYSDVNNLVHNISSHLLTDAEARLLARGWEFCVERCSPDFMEFSKKLQSTCHPSVFRTLCRHIFSASEQLIKNARRKKMINLSSDELAALKSLKHNSNIVICRADKGNCIVVMNKSDYIDKINDILQGKQFGPIPRSISLEKKQNEMNKFLRELYSADVIDKKLFWRLHSTFASLSVIYGQPKVHKSNYPLRPIISSIGSYNYELSKFLASLLNSHRSELSPSYVKDSFDFSKQIRAFTPSTKQTMISFDVESLYTNVPVTEAIEIALDLLYKRKNKPDTKLNRSQMRQLMNFAVRDVPFRFHDKIFVQLDGVAMGSPLAPILADLFMSKMEEKLKRFSANRPKVWLRYVDDVFCIFDIDNKRILEFLSRINNWHPNLTFTKVEEDDGTLPFLDVLVKREKDTYSTTVYRKPTHTDLYLLWDSNQSRKYKVGLIKTLTVRIERICSTDELKKQEKARLYKILKTNGYPAHIIRRGIRDGEFIASRSKQPPIQTAKKQTIFFTIGYYGEETMIFATRLRRICAKLIPNINIHIAFKKQCTLKQNFLPLLKGRDQTKKLMKLVYKIPCKNCDAVYIGETNRLKSKRIAEHQKAIKKKDENSEMVKHILEYNHSMDFSNVDTLVNETDWKRRIIKESIFTHESNGKAINKTKFELNVFG